MKTLIIIAFLACIQNTYSQGENDPEYVPVNWVVWTEKTISQIDSTVVYQADSILMSVGVSSNYKIKIVSKKDTVYEVLFRQIIIDTNFQIESELINTSSLEKMMETMMTELQQKFSRLEYSFLVDRNTGQAFDVKNQEALGKEIEEMVVAVLNGFVTSSKMNFDEKKKEEIKQRVNTAMKEKMTAVMNTMMNSFNYIFQAYSFPYTPNRTYTMDLIVYDIDEVKHGRRETEAKAVINSSVKNSKLMIDYEYVYDKESAYQQYIVSKGRKNQIPIDQFEADERVVSNFDLKTSWISDFTSFVKVKMGDVRVLKTSRVIIN